MMIRFTIAALGLAVFVQAVSAQTITFGTLVDEMTDLRALARYPEPGYRTIQFSSYDRRSKLPEGPNWYANSDGFGNEPIPNVEEVLREPADDGIGEYLICDVEGPGAIVRTWTAAINGEFRVYLDSAPDPIYDGPAQEFLSYSSQHFLKDAGIPQEDLEGVFQQRDACYFPIPFAQRCRIEWTGKISGIHFYEVQIRLYEPHAELATFEPTDVTIFQDSITRAADILQNPDLNYEFESEREAEAFSAELDAGESDALFRQEAQGAIGMLELKLNADDLNAALRHTLMKIRFDGHSDAQVLAPVGDFFGAAPGVNPYDSMPFSVMPDGAMVCRFVMPYRESVELILENWGEQTVNVEGRVLTSAFEMDDEFFTHFRARWRVDHDLISKPERDLPFLMAKGKGLYVGTTSYLLNPNPVPASYGNWWGEGDEKIFVDGEDFPSTFGTGSEDYYNYSWSSPDIFYFPYCGQPRNDGPGNRGFAANNRWHVIDALPFETSIAFYMELFFHENTPGVSYARMSYYYATPGTHDDTPLIAQEDLRAPVLSDAWSPAARAGAANATFHQGEDLAPANASQVMLKDNLFAEGEAWAWTPSATGDQLTLTIPIESDGRYAFRLTCVHSPRSGSVSFALNGEDLDHMFDLHVPYRTYQRTHSLPDMDLTAGEQELTMTYEGAPDGSPGEIGIDFIWVHPR